MDGCILHTKDSGASWKSLESHVTEHLFGIQIIGQNGWATGMKGRLSISKDGGLTWTTATDSVGVNVWLRRVHFFDQKTGFLCGAGGSIRYTQDGIRWTEPDKLILNY
jgi:photosystem II stability/assembly factor-like uncharacterized protein